MIPETVSPAGLRERAKIMRENRDESCARHLELAANEVARLRKALEEINSQAVCACIAKQDECFQMLENCAEISDAALSSTECAPSEIVEGSQS
jgi:hypothetical protein